jgi:hypothetical protein
VTNYTNYESNTGTLEAGETVQWAVLKAQQQRRATTAAYMPIQQMSKKAAG